MHQNMFWRKKQSPTDPRVPMCSNQFLRKWKPSRKPAVRCRTHDTDPSDTWALPHSRWRRVSQWHPPAQQALLYSVFPDIEKALMMIRKNKLTKLLEAGNTRILSSYRHVNSFIINHIWPTVGRTHWHCMTLPYFQLYSCKPYLEAKELSQKARNRVFILVSACLFCSSACMRLAQESHALKVYK